MASNESEAKYLISGVLRILIVMVSFERASVTSLYLALPYCLRQYWASFLIRI